MSFKTLLDSVAKLSPLKAIGTVALVAAVAVLAFSRMSSGHAGVASPFPAAGPAEFLYLDGTRVLAYLAQFDGGNFTSEQLTSKLASSQNSTIAVEKALELGQSSEQERSVVKQISPTAAGNFIELLSKLEGLPNGLTTVGLDRFDEDVQELTEGQFVRFRTHALTSPVYLNPYLAVRDPDTLSTLLPMPATGLDRARVEAERIGVRHFVGAVGTDPRVVFALRPTSEREHEAQTGLAGNGGTTGPGTPSAAQRRAEKERRTKAEEAHVQYLMPLDARLITEERSLLKFGGGEFTVVGKIVRIFPEGGDDHRPAYVDSPTEETWAQPLATAPLKLLCRTDPKCMALIRADGVTSEQRRGAFRHSRAFALEALAEQTQIPVRGAVIVPIAIYK